MNIEKMEIQKQFDLAFKFHQEKNFIEAKKIYEKILTIKPNYKEVLFLLGTLLLQIEDFLFRITFIYIRRSSDIISSLYNRISSITIGNALL